MKPLTFTAIAAATMSERRRLRGWDFVRSPVTRLQIQSITSMLIKPLPHGSTEMAHIKPYDTRHFYNGIESKFKYGTTKYDVGFLHGTLSMGIKNQFNKYDLGCLTAPSVDGFGEEAGGRLMFRGR